MRFILNHRTLESYWSEARSFYKTQYWRDISRKCKERDNYQCRLCSCRAETSEERRLLHAHHVVSRRPVAYPTMLDQLSNLITLCSTCHEVNHKRSFAHHAGNKSAPPKMFRARRFRRF